MDDEKHETATLLSLRGRLQAINEEMLGLRSQYEASSDGRAAMAVDGARHGIARALHDLQRCDHEPPQARSQTDGPEKTATHGTITMGIEWVAGSRTTEGPGMTFQLRLGPRQIVAGEVWTATRLNGRWSRSSQDIIEAVTYETCEDAKRGLIETLVNGPSRCG